MKLLLPRRIFPSMVMAFAIIILTPKVLLADMAAQWVFYDTPLLILGLIPIIVIEGIVLHGRMALALGRAMRVAAVTNIVSALLGAALDILIAVSSHYHGPVPFVTMLLMLLPLFALSWGVEYVVALLMLKPGEMGSATPSAASPQPPRASLERAVCDANVASYIFLALVLVVFAGPSWFRDLRNPPPPWGKNSSPVGSLRTINTAEVTYSSTYTTGFSASLAALGLPRVVGPLIDPQLASGEKTCKLDRGGHIVEVVYRFTYTPIHEPSSKRIKGFIIKARPVKYEEKLTPSLFVRFPSTEDPRDIHVTFEDRDATPADFPWNPGNFELILKDRVATPATPADFPWKPWLSDLDSQFEQIVQSEERIYAPTHQGDFSPSLAPLAESSPHVDWSKVSDQFPLPTAEGAELIDDLLAGGEKADYRFVYTPGPPDAKGLVSSYNLTASPIEGAGHGNFYYTDQSGVIRMNTTRPATKDDPPLGG